jgi:hypothetical protein
MEPAAEKVQEVVDKVKNVAVKENKPKGEKKAKKAKEPSSDGPLEVRVDTLSVKVGQA